jgi:hypothetical protein
MEEEQTVALSELEMTVSHVTPDGNSIKEFHIRACSSTSREALQLFEEAFKKHDVLMRTQHK